MQEQKLKSQECKGKKNVTKQGKNAENVFYESSSQERLTVEATDFKEFFLKKKHTHQNIPLGMQPKRKQIRESQLSIFTDLKTKSKWSLKVEPNAWNTSTILDADVAFKHHKVVQTMVVFKLNGDYVVKLLDHILHNVRL